MRSSIATYRESLSRLANEVLDAADDLETPRPRGGEAADYPSSGRRFSRRLSGVSPPARSPVANGVDSGHHDEIAKYKADILKLQSSEAEIRALSVNYATMLKEKEDQLSKLRDENGSLKKSLEASIIHPSSDESYTTLSNASNLLKRNTEQSSGRLQKYLPQENSHSVGNHTQKLTVTKQDGFRNGDIQTYDLNVLPQNVDLRHADSHRNGKEYLDLLQENESLSASKSSLESDIEQLRTKLKSEQENQAILRHELQKECQLKLDYLRELNDHKKDKEMNSVELKELRMKVDEKISELRQLEDALKKQDMIQESNASIESMKYTINKLEEENAKLKMEKDELEKNLKLHMKASSENSDSTEDVEKMSLSLRKLEEQLKDANKERDKALQESARLKQHLLEKELEDSDKMDEDSKMIEDLQANCEQLKARVLQLEKTLKQEIAKKEEFRKLKNDELHKLNEVIDDLKQKLANCLSIIDSKNVELLNLQTALGQYYAESEAKERLGRDLFIAREEAAKLSELLKVANQELLISKREKEEIGTKLTQTETMLLEGKRFIQKLEEDNVKLRHALEKSMMTLNRMSLDSDNYVDRRIVIKLLVTYFQRNHSKEVLDLMARMLGFSDEDKQRIGIAQHAAGKGVVRGVLGLPGRLVGGIMRGSSPETSSQVASDNQSFTDLWVDFLLKETEEREKRESSDLSRLSNPQDMSTSSSGILSSVPEYATKFQSATSVSGSPSGQFLASRTSSTLPSEITQKINHLDAEFATVPLTSSVHPSQSSVSHSRLLPRY
ncbi:golgin candidate 4-like isoform X1 [Zingiber officinale]|uniref:golgin candidate 4-like isoform X1 n=1 Tax=Zingiber officinale TaxID=94328 RepID=UPI001C4AC187|nr:golgin candidate 4-like isoform X1 [Zingiber officinale]